jgi:hypothetical protein
VIELTRHKIGMDEAKILTVGFAMNRNLTKLDLWENSISSETAIYLVCTCLERNPSLTHINLGENNLDSDCRLEINKIKQGTKLKIDMF